MTLFNFFYLIVLLFIYLLFLPVLLFLMFLPKYKHSLKARFFLYKNPSFKSVDLWIHACSFGETKAIKPIVNSFKEKTLLSVITQTGFQQAQKYVNNVRYLPFEIFLPYWIGACKVLVVVEAELWLMLFFIAKKKGAKTLLVNARISDRSFPRYKKFLWLYKRIFKQIDTVYAQTELDKIRLESLGALNVKVIGNIKQSSSFVAKKHFLKPKRKIIVLASTHEKEEALLLEQLKNEDAMLVVVPRHPERFKNVKTFLQKHYSNKKLSYFSESGWQECDILLMDCMGELINCYEISDVTILCGSFVQGIGGHNPIEPASFGNIIISGPYYFNQNALFNKVKNIYITNIEELKELLSLKLLHSSIDGEDPVKIVIEDIKDYLK